jgi:hypothetical protein
MVRREKGLAIGAALFLAKVDTVAAEGEAAVEWTAAGEAGEEKTEEFITCLRPTVCHCREVSMGLAAGSGSDSNWDERRCRGIVISLLALLVSALADVVRVRDGNLLFLQQRLLLFQSARVYLCLESFGGFATDLHRREGEGSGSHLGCSGEGRHMRSAAMTTMLALKGGALKIARSMPPVDI